jgi:hypothetical protein
MKIFRPSIKGVKNITSVTINVLLMTAYPSYFAVELPQFVHILFQYVHNAFKSNHIEMSTITALIYTHKLILLPAAECSPYPENVFLYVHTTPQHTTANHNTT